MNRRVAICVVSLIAAYLPAVASGQEAGTTKGCNPTYQASKGQITVRYSRHRCSALARQTIDSIRQELGEFTSGFNPDSSVMASLISTLHRGRLDLGGRKSVLLSWIGRYSTLDESLAGLAANGGSILQDASNRIHGRDLAGAGQQLDIWINEPHGKTEEELTLLAHVFSVRARVSELQMDWDNALAPRMRSVKIRPNDAQLRYDLAALLSTQGRREEALDRLQRLRVGTLDTTLRAQVLEHILILYARLRQPSDRLRVATELVAVLRELATVNPDKYTPKLATALSGLGVYQLRTMRNDEAITTIDEAVELRRALAIEEPMLYAPGVALNLVNLGVLHRRANRLVDAEIALTGAIQLYRQMRRDAPAARQPELAGALSTLGGVYAGTFRFAEGEELVTESVALYEQLYAADPTRGGPSLLQSRIRLASIQLRLKHCTALLENLTQARSVAGWEAHSEGIRRLEFSCGGAG
jgi:tetratricopeptide (TPR) repeat protein